MKQGRVGILTGRIRYMSLIRYIWKRGGGEGQVHPYNTSGGNIFHAKKTGASKALRWNHTWGV